MISFFLKRYCLTGLLLCLLPLYGRAQFSGQLEVLKGLSSQSPGIYTGPSLVYHRRITRDIFPGISTGFLYSLADGRNRESFSVPLLFLARYYIDGYRPQGGSEYLEMGSGVNLDYYEKEGEEDNEAVSSVILNVGMTMGYQLPKSYDFGLRMGLLLRESQPLYYLGLRLGHTL
tara:strand:+ start:181 stop:702 length:522 start_codon:yes stop_codon:yes gene_type:complete